MAEEEHVLDKIWEMIKFHSEKSDRVPTHIILGYDIIRELERYSGIFKKPNYEYYVFGCKIIESESEGIIAPYVENESREF